MDACGRLSAWFCLSQSLLLNLILAVVIDSANQARQETDHQQAQEKEKQYEKATAKLLSFCQGLDKDQSGSLSLDELVSGYDDNVDFEDAMTLLDITQKDMNTVFRIISRRRLIIRRRRKSKEPRLDILQQIWT